MKKLITQKSMNYLVISSFSEAKKKRKVHIEEELQYVNTITNHLKAANPVKWYNNLYHILKRSVFLIFAVSCFIILISSFTHQNSYKNFFNDHFEGIISAGLNETFGMHKSIIVSETSAVQTRKMEEVITKPVRADIQNNISNNAYTYFLNAGRVIFLLATFLAWYIARPTKKLHLKNKLISSYYDSNLTTMNIYKELIEEQNFEIEFLTKASADLHNR